MITVKRLDLGVDVAYLPTRREIYLHPDLNFGESMAAISKVAPELHMDHVKNLVARVTPTPIRHERNRPSVLLSLVGGAMMCFMLLGGLVSPAPATAEHITPFGPRWQVAAATLNLRCDPPESDVLATCHRDGHEYRVTRYGEGPDSMYVIRGKRGKIVHMVETIADDREFREFISNHDEWEQVGSEQAFIL